MTRQGRHFLGSVSLGLVALLAVDCIVAWAVLEDRRHHLEAASDYMDGRLALYESFTRRMVAGIDQFLLVLGDRMHAGDDPRLLGDLVNDLIDRSPVTEWAVLVDGGVEARFSGASASSPTSVPLVGGCGPGDARLRIVASPPRDSGPRFLSLCRTYSDARTATQAAVSLPRLAVLFAESRGEASGRLELSLIDGSLLFSLGSGEDEMSVTGIPSGGGTERPDRAITIERRDGSPLRMEIARSDGIDWLIGERIVSGYPLVVGVRLPLDEVLGDWRARAWTWTAVALVFNAGFVALTAVLWRQASGGAAAARRLIASELQASAVFDQAFQIIILLEPDGRVCRLNETAARVLNLGPDNVVGRPLWDGLWGGADALARHGEARQLKAAVETAAEGGIARYEARPVPTESGAEIVFDVVVKPVRDADGAIGKVMVEGRDVTEALRTRDTLVRSERLAALGGLVAGIAHEINTPIGIATTSASYLAREVRDLRHKVDTRSLTASGMEEFLGAAAEAAELTLSNCGRAAELIHSFKQVAVDQVGGERRRFKLAGYIDEILLSLRPRLKREPHKVEVDCPAELELDTDAGALSHSLTNLVVNALVHAFPDGRVGTIRITARALDDGMVKLVFSDDGIGIPKSVQERVFDPFFTTKRGAGGSGLGLHIVHRAVTAALGGTLRLVSDGGRGTAFVMTFPRVAPETVHEDAVGETGRSGGDV